MWHRLNRRTLYSMSKVRSAVRRGLRRVEGVVYGPQSPEGHEPPHTAHGVDGNGANGANGASGANGAKPPSRGSGD